jgi:SAF domain
MASVEGPPARHASRGNGGMPPPPPPAPPGDPAVRARQLRAAAVPPAALPQAPYRRRWGRIAAGAVLVLLGGLVTASLFVSAGNRVEVLALANDVAKNETIEPGDLTRVRVGSDGGVDTVPADRFDETVGRVAAMDIPAGGVLSPRQLRPSGENALADGEAVVGLLLSSSAAPLGQLRAGVSVEVVVRPPTGTQGRVDNVEGRLLDASAEPEDDGDRPVDVVVPASDAAEISAASAEDRVTVVVLGG